MKLLIGIDERRRFESALAVLERLAFQPAEWHFSHVVSPVDPSPTSDEHTGKNAANILAEYLGDSPESRTLINHIVSELHGHVHLGQGDPPSALMRTVEDLNADIVGLGSSGRSALGAAFLGSVGRAFAIGSQSSFLIGRGTPPTNGKLRVVFATDHSEYCRNAFKEFLKLHPTGIEHLVIMTAQEMLEVSEMVEYMALVEEGAKEGRTLHEHLEVLGKQAVTQCAGAGIAATAELRPGFVGQAIKHAAEEHRADLLVLGAQGHGFIERLLIGSVALHEVVTGSHNTLILRSPVERLDTKAK